MTEFNRWSEPKTSEGKEKTDIYNPDPKKRSHPIIGLVFISGFTKKSDTRWENGTVYDPKSGKTYSCFMELQGPDKIKVRGYIGIALMGRNYTWTRANYDAQQLLHPLLSVVILVSNRNTSRRVWEKLSDQGESHNAR